MAENIKVRTKKISKQPDKSLTPFHQNYFINSAENKINSLKQKMQDYQYHVEQLKEELEETENELIKFREILQASADPILITDPTPKIIYANPAWEKLTGYKLEEVIGENPRLLQSGKTPISIYKKMWKNLTSGKSFTSEQIIDKRKDGIEYLTHSTIFPVVKNNHTLFYVQITYDITEKMKEDETKSRLAAMVEFTSDAILGTDLNSVITNWNHAAEKMYGYSKEEIIGQPIDILIPPYKKEESFYLKNRLRRGRFIKELQTQRVRKDGRIIDVSLSISPIKDSSGKMIGFSSMVRDITEHKKLEEKLRLLSEAVEEAPDGIQIVDLDGKIMYSNKAVTKIYGFRPSELRGKHVNSMNADPTFASKVIIPSIKEKGGWTGELMVKHKRGKIFPVWLTTSLVEDEKNNPIAMIGIIRDITENKRLEELKKEFLSTAAHELKTPVTTLKLLSQTHLLRYKKYGEEKINIKEIELIDQELAKLTRLINDILDDSRIETGRLNLQLEVTNLSPIIDNVIKKLEMISKSHYIKVVHPKEVFVIGDSQRLEQVLTNLLDNAAKYSPSKSMIMINARKKRNCAVVSVKDQGQGILKRYLPLIFDRFYQVEKERPKGFGLGLYISKQIIERHRGKIWVKSQKGKGSTFFFAIPLAKVN